MLGAPCSPCCAKLPHVGLAMNGWGPTFHSWNTASVSYWAGTFAENTLATYLANDQWTTLGYRYDSQVLGHIQRAMSPYPVFNPRIMYTRPGPVYSTVEVYRTSSVVRVRLTLRHTVYDPLLLDADRFTGLLSESDLNSQSRITTEIIFERSLDGFWESALQIGTFLFGPSDVASFSSVPQAVGGAVASADDVGTLAIIHRPQATISEAAWTKPLSFPLQVTIETAETEFSYRTPKGFPTQCNDSDTHYFYVGTGVPVQAVSSGQFSFNSGTTQRILCAIREARAIADNSLIVPGYQDPSGYGIKVAFGEGAVSQWSYKVVNEKTGEVDCGQKTLTTVDSSSFPVAGVGVHQAYWEAFSDGSEVAIPCSGRNPWNHWYPGSVFGRQKPGFNTDSTITVRMI